jgi:hypothetical protein
VRSRCGGCARREERSRLDASLAQLRRRRPLSSIDHHIAQSTVPEIHSTRCSLVLAGVRRAGLADVRVTGVVHRKAERERKFFEAVEAAAGDLVQ